MVNLDIREGLDEDITLKWGDKAYTQKLDYMGILFKCNRCHIYGHVVAKCNLPFKKKVWEGNYSKTWKAKLVLGKHTSKHDGLEMFNYGDIID